MSKRRTAFSHLDGRKTRIDGNPRLVERMTALAAIRKSLGVTLGEVAVAAGMTPQRVSDAETKWPRYETLIKVVVGLNRVTPRKNKHLLPVTIAAVMRPFDEAVRERLRAFADEGSKRAPENVNRRTT